MTNVSDVTGFPEMMDGRVKTLHPEGPRAASWPAAAAPTTSRRIRPQGVELVDLVVVNLYPFARAAANPETPFDELVEEIDIGGPSLLRAAGKNFRDVHGRGRSGGLPAGARAAGAAGRARRSRSGSS